MTSRMISRSAMGAALVLTLILTGCGAQSGVTRAKYEKGKDLVMTTAPHDGEYALYTMTDLTPKVRQPLSRGDRLGFEKTDEGRIRAVAGSWSMLLDPKTVTAYWKDQSKK